MATGAILLVVAAAISAAAAVQAGQAANQQAKLQSKILQQQADHDRLVAASDEDDFRRQQSRVLAARRAAGGASGIDTGTGSALLVAEDFAEEVELNALRIRSGGEVRATRAEQSATLKRFAGKQAQTAGFLRGSALLAGGTAKAFA